MMEVKQLSFAYRKGGPRILDEINLSIREGCLIAVLGANGAGKTTLFQCMLGFLKNYEGGVYLDRSEIRTLSRKEIAKKIAYIPQSEAPVYNYTVFDSVLMGTTGSLSALQSPGKEQERIAQEALMQLGIEHLSERGMNEISGGERQLALLARALAQKAKILIMDEPTANLDYGNQQQVMHHVQEMAMNGYTILLSTHNPEHALQFATDVIALKDRRILAQGKAETVLKEDLIQEIYGIHVKITEIKAEGKTVRSCIPLKETPQKKDETGKERNEDIGQ